MAVVVLTIAAVFFLGMGVYALAAPAAMLRPFAIELPEAQSRSEVRAVYGGYGLAMAVVLTFAAIDPGFHRAGIMTTVGAALAGMALGRLLSALVDKPTPFYPNWFYFLVEVVAGATLLATA
ncbi:DUF4345 domain-containing protein [Mycobacterium intermedium]|uniref:DUF4345 domain-containing protein n=1 Tax=Mycobacterium intermedium TaxID=28445 RepID=A0A1E3S4Z0_MYCIE|nr:DUF4345 domain-containing protein [Mycobacterium intermedium]MCV6966407.1 DUF4345 domain-containing protein [Mycobacterium intermedium]ODQ97235.1 DUF4345 domain-containing protein [Mycobacterium intermedium]OPE45659.1 DUF4345 domain-containing protein [Mycobacterium intermedium]ORA96572.1 DUF4345 domain-containing protein [Mycobacterium intermedium]